MTFAILSENEACNNGCMSGNKILEELARNKKNVEIGKEFFGTSPMGTEVKRGAPIKEIIEKMQKASKQNVIRISNNVSAC